MATHEIISMERGETSGSKSPMWRCRTLDNQKVNIFSHSNPTRDSARLFYDAGYRPFMQDMQVGEQTSWNASPIPVTMRKDGEWWALVEVEDCEDRRPDPKLCPDAKLYRLASIEWARQLVDSTGDVVIWDTETTGLTDDDEILSIGAVYIQGGPMLSTRIRPTHPERIARLTEVHGFVPEDFADARSFAEVYADIEWALNFKYWVIYHVDFDLKMLHLACMRYGLLPLLPLGTVDVMKMFSYFYGEWDAKHGHFAIKTLSFAAEHLGIDVPQAHEALADAQTTLAVIRAMAGAAGEAVPTP